MVCSRPDIAHAVGVVSQFLSNSGKEHWAAVKWILRYLRGTSKVCLCFGDGKPMLDGFTDSDIADNIDSRKSTSEYLMTFAEGVWHVNLNNKKELLSQLPKLNLLLLQKLAKKSYG